MTSQTTAQSSKANLYFKLLKDEITHATGMWKKAVTFQYTVETWLDDVSDCGNLWLQGVNALFGGVLPVPVPGEVPAVVFVMDFEAKEADPKVVFTPGFVDSSTEVKAELRQIGTGTSYDANVVVDSIGALLKIGLQDLKDMDPGHSAGVVYANEQGGAKMALAHIYVTKLPQPPQI